jgi:hypothetical protein
MASEPVYERPVAPVPTGTAATGRAASGTAWGSLAARIVLTLLGAAGMIVGALLVWLRSPLNANGTQLHVRILWDTSAHTTSNFVATVGFVMIVLGLLAVLGLAFRSGWLTRLAGALGIVAWILFLITIARSHSMHFPGSMGVGAWIALIGSVVALIGGFLGVRVTSWRSSAAAAPAVPPGTTTTTTTSAP